MIVYKMVEMSCNHQHRFFFSITLNSKSAFVCCFMLCISNNPKLSYGSYMKK